MDPIDKKIITRLLVNSRESFRSIGREFDVSCPTIKNRVDRLRQWGVIQQFSAELSQEALGLDWVLIELTASQKQSKADILQQLAENKCIGEVLMLGSGKYNVFAEVCPSERGELISCINRLDIESCTVSDLIQIRNGVIDGDCKFTTRGSRIKLTRNQVAVLRQLTMNARMPVNQISDLTGLTAKSIRRVIQHFVECDAIHLTLRLNLPSSGKVNFLIRYGMNESTTGPMDATGLVTDLYPEEHWFTFYEPETNEMVHYMTANNVRDVESITQEIRHLPHSEDVDTQIIYSSMKAEGRTPGFIHNLLRNGYGESSGTLSLLDNRAAQSY